MGRTNKLALAINAFSIASQNQSNYVITNPRRDLDDKPAIAMNELKGKRGKKGKSLKDWN